jgi:hypothetical protein
MRGNAALLVFTLCLNFGVLKAEAESPEHKCPVVINRVELSYNHQGGVSKPQLTIEFDNHAGKQISKITFNLSVLDEGGYPHPYSDDLTYLEGLETGKRKVYIWDLASEAVNIHRTGETVVVEKVEFIDTTSWIDDGSESCVYTVDYHAR